MISYFLFCVNICLLRREHQIFNRIDSIGSVCLDTMLVLDHIDALFFQCLTEFSRNIIGNNSCIDLIKTNLATGLSLKVLSGAGRWSRPSHCSG